MTAIRDRDRGRPAPAGAVDLSEEFPDAPPPVPPAPPTAGLMPRVDGPLDPANVTNDPANRLSNVQGTGEGYIEEYRLSLLHRLLLRNLPLDIIARSMNTSITRVTSLRKELYKRLKHEAGNVDMLTHSGRTLAFYNEIRGQALKMATDANKTDSARLKALLTSLQAERDKHGFLKDAGFYDSVKYQPKSGAPDTQADQAKTLGDIAREILDPESDLSALRNLEELDSEEAIMERGLFGNLPEENNTVLL